MTIYKVISQENSMSPALQQLKDFVDKYNSVDDNFSSEIAIDLFREAVLKEAKVLGIKKGDIPKNLLEV